MRNTHFLNWVLMKYALKVCRFVRSGGDEEVHHIPHTWVNSCREAGFRSVCVGGGSQPKNWTNSCRGVGLGAHSLNLGQFSKIIRYWIP